MTSANTTLSPAFPGAVHDQPAAGAGGGRKRLPSRHSRTLRMRGQGATWIEYRYSEPRTIESAEVYWAEDAGGRGCALPASWSLAWWDGSAWKPVEGVAAYPTEKQFNPVRFTPARTNAIRLQVVEQSRQPAGILEWRID